MKLNYKNIEFEDMNLPCYNDMNELYSIDAWQINDS